LGNKGLVSKKQSWGANSSLGSACERIPKHLQRSYDVIVNQGQKKNAGEALGELSYTREKAVLEG